MRNVNLNKLKVLSPRMDWLSVLGDVPHIDREKDKENLIQIFHQMGFHKTDYRERLSFRTNVHGIEIMFGRTPKTGSRFLKIEFQGQFFADSMENCEKNIRSVVNKLWFILGVKTPPRVTRVDIAIDILDITHKKLWPDFTQKRYEIVSNTKEPPRLKIAKYYLDPEDRTIQTGVSIKSSRFEFALYERLEKLKEYDKIPHKLWYCRYYRDLYQEAWNVLRIEVRLKKNQAEYFCNAFFIANYTIDESIKRSLAHYNHHHRFLDKKTNKYIKHIDQLFYNEEYESIKTLRDKHNVETDLRGLHFPTVTTDFNPATTQIANSLIMQGRTSESDLEEIKENIAVKIVKNSEKVQSEIIAQRKTENLFNFCRENQKEYEENYKKTMQELNSMQNEHEHKRRVIKEKMNPELIKKTLDSNKVEKFKVYQRMLEVINNKEEYLNERNNRDIL